MQDNRVVGGAGKGGEGGGFSQGGVDSFGLAVIGLHVGCSSGVPSAPFYGGCGRTSSDKDPDRTQVRSRAIPTTHQESLQLVVRRLLSRW